MEAPPASIAVNLSPNSFYRYEKGTDNLISLTDIQYGDVIEIV